MPILKNKIRLLRRNSDFHSVENDLIVKAEEDSHSTSTLVKIEVNSQDAPIFSDSIDMKVEETLYEYIPDHIYIKMKLEADSTPATNPSSSIDKSATSQPYSSTKNTNAKIIRNYAQALCAFAYSKLSVPYLQALIEQPEYVGKVKVHYFQRFIKSRKRYAHNIPELRNLLLVTSDDEEREAIYKKLFASICEVFIKYFSVNWIFSGKVKLIDDHLKFRYKMLRRIRNPEFFTYLRTKVNLGRKDKDETD